MKTYLLTTAYNDCTCKAERADLLSILRALAIYYEEPDFFSAHVIDIETQQEIINITKS